jgi:uncharacterized integral membrane protein
VADAEKAPATRREKMRLGVAVVSGVLITAFALANLDEVKVNWLLGSWSTPLIVVIAVSFLLGGVTGVVAARGRRSEER